jgi:hypothetical protein
MSAGFRQTNGTQAAKRTKFYVAKVEQAGANLLKPLSLYACDDAAAENEVRTMRAVPKDDTVYVQAVDAIYESFFGRSVRDGRNVVVHENLNWAGQRGPIVAINPFTPT